MGDQIDKHTVGGRHAPARCKRAPQQLWHILARPHIRKLLGLYSRVELATLVDMMRAAAVGRLWGEVSEQQAQVGALQSGGSAARWELRHTARRWSVRTRKSHEGPPGRGFRPWSVHAVHLHTGRRERVRAGHSPAGGSAEGGREHIILVGRSAKSPVLSDFDLCLGARQAHGRASGEVWHACMLCVRVGAAVCLPASRL